jgi:hypothetical protein
VQRPIVTFFPQSGGSRPGPSYPDAVAGVLGAVFGCLVLNVVLWRVSRAHDRGLRPLRPIAATTFALAGILLAVLGLPSLWPSAPAWILRAALVVLGVAGWWLGLQVADKVYADRTRARAHHLM